MVPGCVSGLYTQAQTKINLEPLANYAGVTFVNAKVASADLDGCKLLLDNGSELVYDVVSFDIGSATRGHDEVKGAREFTIPTRPISELVTRIEEAERGIGVDDDVEVVVVGGGAAGIELAFAIKARWGKERTGKTRVEILDSNNVLFPGESESCRGAVVKELSKRGIKVTHGAVVKEVREGEVELVDGRRVSFTHSIWATGATCHGELTTKLKDSGLEIDKRGWIKVDAKFRSVSHANVFAAGDCCTIVDDRFKAPPKAGVYAVRAGPILIDNLVRAVGGGGEELVEYSPQADFLKLLMLGDGSAIGFRFGESISGPWVWELKDMIDVGFMDLFDVETIGGEEVEGDVKKDYDEHENEKEMDARKAAEEIDATTAGREMRSVDREVNVLVNWHILKRMMKEEGSDWFCEARRVWAGKGVNE